jgi:hypothetical protein
MALALLVVVIVHADPAEAQASTTPLEQDIWRQIQPPITGSNSGAQTTTALALTAGQTYFLYVGTNAAFGQYVNAGTSGNDMFSIDKFGVLTPGANGPDAVLISMTNTTATYNPFYAVIRVTPTQTANYVLSTNSGGFGSPGSLSTGWTFPAGDNSAHASVLGYAGAWGHSGAPSNHLAFAIKCCPQVQGEAGIMSRQTSKAPASSKLSWARINPPKIFAQLDGAGSGGNIGEIAQSFPAPIGGAYVEITRIGMFGSGNWNCGGTLRISITNTLSVPWNNLAEVAAVQASWTLSGGAPTNNYVTVDWVSAVLSDDAGSVSFGTPAWSIGGSTVTGENLKTLAPFITPAQGTYYLRAYWDNSGCTPSAYVMSRYSGGNSYADGTAWYVSGGVWTQEPSQDFGGILLNAYGGNKTYEWKLNSTQQNIGGATYFYIGEHQRDSNLGLATPSSSWGGTALFGKHLWELSGSGTDCAFNGISNSLCMLREYRLGYMPQPYNTTGALTITMNMNGMGRNLVYVGTLQNQPTQTHVDRLVWDYQESSSNDLVVYQVWSTDDYFAFAEFTVKECANADCTEFGPTLSNVSYSAKICGGIRNAAGTPDAEGKFNISGQDLPGCEIVITLTGSGYAETAWSVQITSGGTHLYTLGIFKAGTTSGNAQLAATTVIFTGNTTRYIPDRVAINITRGRNADLFVGLDKVDATSGLVQHNVIRATYWKAFDGNTFQFYYPNKAKSTSQEIGLYVLWVMNETGVVLNHTKFFILAAGGNVGDYDVTITADFLRGIEEKGYISAQQTFQSQYQASILAVQKSVRDQVYEDFRKVSEYGWFVIGFLLFLATVRAFRR